MDHITSVTGITTGWCFLLRKRVHQSSLIIDLQIRGPMPAHAYSNHTVFWRLLPKHIVFHKSLEKAYSVSTCDLKWHLKWWCVGLKQSFPIIMPLSTTRVPQDSLTFFLCIMLFWQLRERSGIPDIWCKHEMLILSTYLILPTAFQYSCEMFWFFPMAITHNLYEFS